MCVSSLTTPHFSCLIFCTRAKRDRVSAQDQEGAVRYFDARANGSASAAATKMAKAVAFDMYAGFDKMFVAIYVIGRAKSVNTQFGRNARV